MYLSNIIYIEKINFLYNNTYCFIILLYFFNIFNIFNKFFNNITFVNFKFDIQFNIISFELYIKIFFCSFIIFFYKTILIYFKYI